MMTAARLAGAAVARAAALLLVASAVIFLLAEALPGDVAQARFGGRASPEQLAALRQAQGLDRPAYQRYLEWLGGALTGDPGRSLVTGRPVADVLAERMPVTGTLLVASLAITVPLLVALAWFGVRGPRWTRAAVTALIVTGAALPQVVVATGLVALLSAVARLVPPVSLIPAGVEPWHRPDLLVLPVLTLALPSAAYGATLLRGVLADVVARPYVVDAELRGLPSATVLVRYALPPAAAPLARVLTVITGGLVVGTALAETLFGLSGAGELLVTAVGVRDIPVVLGVALPAAAVVVCGLLVADLIARMVAEDPQRAASSGRRWV